MKLDEFLVHDLTFRVKYLFTKGAIFVNYKWIVLNRKELIYEIQQYNKDKTI